ncbi:solute carrier family 41 member 1 [Ephemerocybe angulata]|uniref:Solute carrier family 41 member 1 n=1 Tax=Ephemerocybe angulata TaxID=980116 RepID=A0A8H6M9U9_9AGAR|nr:solute carrier family 41 member 1 [Tulosesus angulatus]
MNPNSPGNGALGDDVEMAPIVDVAERPAKPQNGSSGRQAPPTPEDSDYDDEFDVDDGERGLLSSSRHTESHVEARHLRAGKLWHQVKSIVVEAAPTLLLTTISLLFTGKLLDNVSRWDAMQQVDQLIMIIPTVLNLQGNLEMNLSARLSTAANMGELDDPVTMRAMLLGNWTMLQVQAISVSFIAACISLVLGKLVPRVEPSAGVASGASNTTHSIRHLLESRRPIPHLPPEAGIRHSGFPTLIMVSATAMTSAFLSGLILGSFMCFLIIVCRKFKLDPDNIAPAVASCLGDLVTLCLVGFVSTLLLPFLRTPIPFIIGIAMIVICVICLVYTAKNPHVRAFITQGWSPLFGAMIISSATGIVLDMFVSRYEGFAIMAIVISGLPGAAGSIFVSRLSTSLHAAATSASASLRASEPSRRLVMVTLLLITVPVEIVFLAVLNAFGWLNTHLFFIIFSVIFFCCTVGASLTIAQYLTDWLWSKNRDPDIYALPLHSAIMDLIGQLLLVLCFEIVTALGTKLRLRT